MGLVLWCVPSWFAGWWVWSVVSCLFVVGFDVGGVGVDCLTSGVWCFG